MTDTPTSTLQPEPAPNFGVGDAISETFKIAFSRIFYFMSVVFCGMVLIYALSIALGYSLFGSDAWGYIAGTATLQGSAQEIIYYVLNYGISIVFGIVLNAIIVRSAITLKLQKDVQFGEGVKSGFAAVIPLVLIFLILMIPYAVGYLFFILPGLFLTAMFYVVGPVAFFERKGLGSLGRSLELTKGYRWAIMGYFVVMAIIYMLIALVVLFVMGLALIPFALSGGATSDPGIMFIVITLFFTILMYTAIMVLGYIPPAVAYMRLREIKDGSGDELLAVFE